MNIHLNNRKYIEKLNGNLNIVGKNIYKIRKENKISRQALSNKLMLLGVDISSQSVYDIENGLRTIVDYELCAIAKILNTSVDELMLDFKNYIDYIDIINL